MIKCFDLCYIIIQAWTLVYLGFSFSPSLPWSNCNNSWNTGVDIFSEKVVTKSMSIEEVCTEFTINVT